MLQRSIFLLRRVGLEALRGQFVWDKEQRAPETLLAAGY